MRSKEERAFRLHKKGAERDRGIEFHFSYEEWVGWWKQHLGPDWFTKRGCRLGQYVMARHGDKGPYAPWNVKCITHSENSREQPKNGKLTEDQVKIIYTTTYQRGKPHTSKAGLARRFKVSIYTVKSIRKKETWRGVTDLLD